MGYSPEQLNFFRLCFIAFDLLPLALRKIFKQEWDFLYSTTCGKWEDTAQNGKDFYHKETIKGKKTSMKTQCLNIVQNGNTAECDCTCLFSAILYSNAIGSTLAPAVRTAVDDLRQVRNGIAHTTKAELSDPEFNKDVGTVINAFNLLGLPVKDIEDVKNQTSFPTDEVENFKKKVRDLQTEVDKTKSDLKQTQEENKTLTHEINSKLEPFCILPLKPPHELIRRSSDIVRISNKMQELHNGSNGAVSTISLSGNPGCGKSQLARQVGSEFFRKY